MPREFQRHAMHKVIERTHLQGFRYPPLLGGVDPFVGGVFSADVRSGGGLQNAGGVDPFVEGVRARCPITEILTFRRRFLEFLSETCMKCSKFSRSRLWRSRTFVFFYSREARSKSTHSQERAFGTF